MVCVAAAGPAMRWMRTARVRALAEEATTLMSERKWQEASGKVQSAYRLKPDEPAVQRAVARFYEATNPSASVPFFEKLLSSPEATAQDRERFAEVLLRIGQKQRAHEMAQAPLEKEPSEPRNMRLIAQTSAALGDAPAALRHAEEAHRLDPANAEGQFLLARLRLDAADPEARSNGWQTLWQLATGDGPIGLQALVFMASRADFPPERGDDLTARLRTHPGREAHHEILAIDQEIRFHPERRQEVLDRAVGQYRAAEPAAARLFGIWLNGKGEPARTLAVLPRALAMTRQDLLLVHLDALASLQQWAEIRDFLEKEKVPLDDFHVFVFLARAWTELGHSTRAATYWSKARQAASGDTDQLQYLASYTERIGALEPAEKAFRALADQPQSARGGYGGLLRLALREKQNARAVRDLLGEMLRFWPQDPAVQNDHAYFSLLLGEAIPQSRATATDLVNQFPESLPHRTTLALAHLRAQDAPAALRVYDGLQIPWESAPPSSRCVYAAVLAAAGKSEDARAMAAPVAPDLLWPEEQALRSEALGRP